MFWDSVWAGLGVLTYWETYAAALVYCVAIPFSLAMMMGAATTLNNKATGGLIACLGMIMLLAVAIPVFLLTLSPIIFGIGEDAAWAYPWAVIFEAPSVFFKLVGVLVVANIVLIVLPFFGSFGTFTMFAWYLVLGGIVLVFAFVHPLMLFNSASFGDVVEHLDILPKFWFIVGFLIIGGILAGLIGMVAALAQTLIEGFSEYIGHMIMFLLVPILSFIPVFIYGAWLGSQIPR